MSSILSMSVFAALLWLAMLGVAAFEIFALGHLMDALFDRLYNLELVAFVNVAVSLTTGLGFGAALIGRRMLPLPNMGLWLSASAIVACGLINTFQIAGPKLSELLGSREFGGSFFVVYCLCVGALVATLLVRVVKAKGYAAR